MPVGSEVLIDVEPRSEAELKSAVRGPAYAFRGRSWPGPRSFCLTPAPPPFSGMKTMPAASRARWRTSNDARWGEAELEQRGWPSR